MKDVAIKLKFWKKDFGKNNLWKLIYFCDRKNLDKVNPLELKMGALC